MVEKEKNPIITSFACVILWLLLGDYSWKLNMCGLKPGGESQWDFGETKVLNCSVFSWGQCDIIFFELVSVVKLQRAKSQAAQGALNFSRCQRSYTWSWLWKATFNISKMCYLTVDNWSKPQLSRGKLVLLLLILVSIFSADFWEAAEWAFIAANGGITREDMQIFIRGFRWIWGDCERSLV